MKKASKFVIGALFGFLFFVLFDLFCVVAQLWPPNRPEFVYFLPVWPGILSMIIGGLVWVRRR